MKRIFALTAATAGMLFVSIYARAEEPLELRKVMQDLGKNMQIVTDAISREDWALVEKTSPLIADHPQPSVRKKNCAS